MKKKCYVFLTAKERCLLLEGLNTLRNGLIAEGRYTDAVDEVIIKVTKARKKAIKGKED